MNKAFFINMLVSLCTLPMSAHAFEVRFVFDQAVEVATPTREGLSNKRHVEPLEPVTISSKDIQWIQARGKVPVVLVPVASSFTSESKKLELPDVGDWPPIATEQEVERKVTLLMDGFAEFQSAMAKKDLQEAEKILARLEAVQNVAYLQFLKASLSFAKGDLEKAKHSVRSGLQRLPSSVQGQEFLKRLEAGGRR